MPFFMNPLAFYAAVSLLAVAAVYLFRRQSRDVKVSTLMFFSTVRVPAEGGRRLTVPQTPLILILELIILTLVVFAAADPRAIIGDEFVPLVVILDDSYSMNAASGETPRQKALNFLETEIFFSKIYRLSLIKAGIKPEFIGRRDMLPAETSMLISNWRCSSAQADIDEAIKLAGESFNPGTRFLVLTDSAPVSTLSGNISWYSFGHSRSNLAITGASRYALGNSDRFFIEFSSFSREKEALKAEIVNLTSKKIIEKIDCQMVPGSVRRLRFSLRETSAMVGARIIDDPVEFDNSVWLMPVRRKPLRVSIAGLPDRTRQLFEHTVLAAENAELNEKDPELIISSNSENSTASGNTWGITMVNATDPVMIRGVVTTDRGHPVCDGLPDVTGQWAISENTRSGGYPLLSLGETILLGLYNEPGGLKRLQMNFVPEYSTIQQTSFWPVLFWNIFSWRQSLLPGPVEFNLRSGMEAVLNSGDAQDLDIETPDGRNLKLQSWKGQCFMQVDEVGIYRISDGISSWTMAVNLLSGAESDLTGRSEYIPENTGQSDELLKHSSDVRWWFIIPALLLLLLHQWLVSRRRQQIVY